MGGVSCNIRFVGVKYSCQETDASIMKHEKEINDHDE